MKVNEFINNDNLKETFDKLDRQIFLETAHLSNINEILNNKHYKLMLENIDDFLPFVVEKILNNKGIFSHRFLFLTATKLKKGDSSFINLVSNWWNDNKYKYENKEYYRKLFPSLNEYELIPNGESNEYNCISNTLNIDNDIGKAIY